MPTYSYRCADCAHAFDIQQAFTDDSLTVCPECGGTLRKVFGNVGVTFSGSGFYRTDSREPKSTSSDAKKPSETSTGSVKDAGGASSAPAKSDSSSSAATTSNKTPAASQ